MSSNLSECLSKARKWLTETDDKFCKRHGLKIHHLTINNISSSEELIEDGEFVGYRISIIRHPCHIAMKQVWNLSRYGELRLDYEKPLCKVEGFRFQGKLRTAEELWG